MSFSAGGHVAARLSTAFDARVYPPADDIDAASARPDAALLVYPVIDIGAEAHPGSRDRLLGPDPTPELSTELSPQLQVTAQTPPTFLLHAQDDDTVPVSHALMYHRALLQAGVPAELHLYAHGGHGFGVRAPADLPVAAWPQLALGWMRGVGIG
ncbi:MAG: prolyl oligopeptidase family serine peptidase [Actinobacteria bacterium]|nr:prolyl oligopeptidase family serine peptidase [Actinomycetota bacterium]